jgi:crotonobetainyl-CoA:carnitine CoA-transferase CaiB-like acyl-CoA transferase
MDPQVLPAFLGKTTAEWVALGLAARVPITPMDDLAQLPRASHWRGRGSFGPFDASGRAAPTLPFQFEGGGGAPAPIARGPAEAPLAGLRVVDFTMGWAGPLCTRTLADLGAEVVKIESEDHPDWWRGWEAGDAAEVARETKFSFISVNRNKRDVTLDLATPNGLAAAKALVARADVLVENFAAGVMEKLGLGRAARRRLNPSLIAVAMPAFGSDGPLAGVRAYGSTVEQASGLPFANGHGHWPPSLQHVAFGDPIAGLYAAAATLAALYGRTAGGAEIDLAQVECLFQQAADALIAQQLTAGPLPRTGSRRPRAAPVCVVAAGGEDSWLAVAVDGDGAWRSLCAALGRPDWVGLALADRAARADEIEAAIAGWAAAQDPASAAEALQAAGVPAAPVQPTHALCYDPQLAATGFFGEMVRPYVGEHLVPNAPWTFDGRRPALRNPAPTLGEHTAEVLTELNSAHPGESRDPYGRYQLI